MKSVHSKNSDSIQLRVSVKDIEAWLADLHGPRELAYAVGCGFAGLVFKDKTDVAEVFKFMRIHSTNREDMNYPKTGIMGKAGLGHVATVQRKIGPQTYLYLAQKVKTYAVEKYAPMGFKSKHKPKKLARA